MGIGENAGVVDIGDGWAVTFKIESHNHPSFIEPYQGAATGVGGIVRDILSMGARPLAIMDPLRFGPAEAPDTRRVLPGVVAGIWGLESGFGQTTGDFRVVEALATLAFEGRRRELFATEFVAVLKMADQGVPRSQLKGSWAGAFGNPQFLPSVYLRVAQDADGDGDGRGDVVRIDVEQARRPPVPSDRRDQRNPPRRPRIAERRGVDRDRPEVERGREVVGGQRPDGRPLRPPGPSDRVVGRIEPREEREEWDRPPRSQWLQSSESQQRIPSSASTRSYGRGGQRRENDPWSEEYRGGPRGPRREARPGAERPARGARRAVGSNAAQFNALIAREILQWRELAKTTKIAID